MSDLEREFYYKRLKTTLKVHLKIVDDDTKATKEEKEEQHELVDKMLKVVDKQKIKRK